MAIKFETLKNYMPEIGLTSFEAKPGKTEFEGQLLALLGIETEEKEYGQLSIGLVLNLQENGEFLQIRFVQMYKKETVYNNPHIERLMQYLLRLNYQRKIGRWCLDPEDGDVCFDWAIGIEDNDKITPGQVLRIIASLRITATEAWPAINRILKTGSELNPEVLKKDILLMLMEGEQFELIKILGRAKIKDLEEIKKYAKEQQFDKIKEIIDKIEVSLSAL